MPGHNVGQRARCRYCDRASRIRFRNQLRGRPDESDDVNPARHHTAAWIVVNVALLVVGLIVGGGLTARYFVEIQPLPADEEGFDPGEPDRSPGPLRAFDRAPDDPD